MNTLTMSVYGKDGSLHIFQWGLKIDDALKAFNALSLPSDCSAMLLQGAITGLIAKKEQS